VRRTASAEVPEWRCTTSIIHAVRDFPLSYDRPNIWAGDAEDLELILGGTVDNPTRAAFTSGGAMVF
jgi:hypothetical protein